MTRDQFVKKWLNELCGMLQASFEVSQPHPMSHTPESLDYARKGKFMIDQLSDARLLLERIHADLVHTGGKNGHNDDAKTAQSDNAVERGRTDRPNAGQGGKAQARPGAVAPDANGQAARRG